MTETASNKAGSPLDPEAMEMLKSLGIAEELMRLFLDEGQRKISILREAVAKRDSLVLRNAAHALKGSAGNFGAHRLMDLAAQLETIGGSDDLSEAAAVLVLVEQEFERVATAMGNEAAD